MKKHIILSVNDNQDYLYFTPVTCWAWRRIGWEPVVMFHWPDNSKNQLEIEKLILNTSNANKNFFVVNSIEGYRSDTITQLSRLYAACEVDGYLMTGDIDLLPLSDYWRPTNGSPTVWGYDLTGYTQFPICYVGMSSEKWADVMRLRKHDGSIEQNYNDLIKRDLDIMPNAKNPDFYKYWFTDQELITNRLKPYKPTVINRGQYPNGYARGRIDRGAWTLDHKEYIDCHMHHQIHHKGNDWKFKQTLEMLHRVWPEDNFDWYIEFHNEFKRLTGHV